MGSGGGLDVLHLFSVTFNQLSLDSSLLRASAIAASTALAGCGGSSRTPAASDRHMQPLSERILADLQAKHMRKEAPILVRIFKEEAELEVWKQNNSGRFALLRTYPICRWSG